VFICVTGSPQVEDLVYRKGGILESARPGQVVVDTSTSQPGSTLKIAGEFQSRGVRFVDAPLTRTPVEAEQGRLNTMVGADAATFGRSSRRSRHSARTFSTSATSARVTRSS